MRKAIFFLVIAWIFIIFSISLRHPFVGDDMVLLEENQYIKNPRSLVKIFTKDYFIISKEPFFRPLPTLTYFLLYQIGGLRPALFRLFNLIFHLLCCYLIFLLMKQLLKQKIVPFISALIFALHPVHIETFNVITYNKDILACFFVLLALYSYFRYKENQKFSLLLISFFSLSAALLSKESALIFILLLLFYEYWITIREKQKFTLRRVINIEYFIFFSITCLYIWIRFFLINPPQTYRFYAGGSFYLNMLTMFRVVTLYIKNLFIPVSLYPEYYVPIPSSLFEFDIIVWGLLILFTLTYIWILRFKLPGLFFSLGWFFITLVPVLNLMPFVFSFLGADRYLYLPSVGFSLFLGIIVNSFLNWKKTWLGYLILIGVIFFFGISGLLYNLEWKTPIKLWERTVQKYPDYPHPRLVLAKEYESAGLYQKAKDICDELLKKDPNNVKALSILGHCYFKGRLYVPAQEIYQRVLLLNSDRVDVLNNLGIIYFKSREFEKTIEVFKFLIEKSPNNSTYYLNLGVVYLAKKDYKQSLEILKKGKEISSKDAEIYFNIGRAYWGLKKRELALQNFREALRINPNAHYVKQEMKRIGIKIE